MIVFKTDGREFGSLGNLYAAAGKDAPRAVRLAVKEVGSLARTGMRRAVRADLRGDFHKIAAQVNKRINGRVVAGVTGAEYHIDARGLIPLKYFRTVQSTRGVNVPGVQQHFILGAGLLPKAFEATTGHAGTRGDRAKRRATLKGNIVVASRGARRALKGATGVSVGSKLTKVPGVSVAKVFVSQRSVAEFEKAARLLPARLSRILFAAIEGQLKGHRGRRPA